MMKKYLALALIAPLLVSCSSSNKKGAEYNEAWVKDTNGFDILMGQFAHNIENIWGYNEVLLAGPKDYVKYTDQYQTRSHINFDEGTITVETIAGTDPLGRLRQAIVKTLLMGDDPNSIDLYSDVDDIQISKEPFLYGQVVDNTGASIRWEWRAARFADYLLQTRLKSRNNGLRVVYSITINLVPNHLDKRAHKYLGMVRQASRKYGVDESLILAIMQTESSFNPYAVSHADAMGLMQVVQHSAGRDVFRSQGKSGLPSRSYLFDPANNIDTGTAVTRCSCCTSGMPMCRWRRALRCRWCVPCAMPLRCMANPVWKGMTLLSINVSRWRSRPSRRSVMRLCTLPSRSLWWRLAR